MTSKMNARIDPKQMPGKGAVGVFYTIYTTPSWRTFMCLRCVHGYSCPIRLLGCASLDILIDLDVQGGKCAMYWKRTWKTERMKFYHSFNTRDWAWYPRSVLRKKRSRVMLAYARPMFDLKTAEVI